MYRINIWELSSIEKLSCIEKLSDSELANIHGGEEIDLSGLGDFSMM